MLLRCTCAKSIPCISFHYPRFIHTSGHPAGAHIWVPLLCDTGALSLNFYSLTNVFYTACKFAKLASTASIYGLSCDVVINNTALYYGKYECSGSILDSQRIGPFMFQDSNNIGRCVAYKFSQVIVNDPFLIFSYVCCAISTMCGVITMLWLLFSTCCPLPKSHQLALQWFTMIAFLCQGSFILAFFGNQICKEAGGCSLDEGSYYAISSAIMYFITNLALLFIVPCSRKKSCDSSLPTTASSINKNTTPSAAANEEQVMTTCGACSDMISNLKNDVPHKHEGTSSINALCSNQHSHWVYDDSSSKANSTIVPSLCGILACCSGSADEDHNDNVSHSQQSV